MKLYQIGDKSQAACPECQARVTTTFALRDVPFTDSSAIARAILVAVCDDCQAVVGIPAQSTPKIRASRSKPLFSIEAQLPLVFVDMLDLACQKLADAASTDLRKRLMAYYIHRLANQNAHQQAELLTAGYQQAEKEFPPVPGKNLRRLSFKVQQGIYEELNALASASQLSKTSILKSLAYQIKEDVLEEKNSRILPELKTLMLCC